MDQGLEPDRQGRLIGRLEFDTIEPAAHDRLMASVSHLPHVLANVLAPFGEEDAGTVFDRYHTPDFVMCNDGIQLDREKLQEEPKGSRAFLPKRWIVERTFSWLGQNWRMSKGYERLCGTGEAFVYAAMIRLMVRRLVRA